MFVLTEGVGVVVVIPVSVSSLVLLASSDDKVDTVAMSLALFQCAYPVLVGGLVRSERANYINLK